MEEDETVGEKQNCSRGAAKIIPVHRFKIRIPFATGTPLEQENSYFTLLG
jgi:hypothetical protein